MTIAGVKKHSKNLKLADGADIINLGVGVNQ